IMRPFNHIGAGQNNRFVVPNFSQQLAKIARGEAPKQLQVGNLEAKRDFSDVRDIVRAYRLAAERGQGTYNLCSGKGVSVREILETLIAISGVEVEIVEDQDRMRASEVPEVYGSYAKARRELGWEPLHSLQESLEQAYKHWVQR
ncbi:MAG: GDP-mannose 4,6-dehydratase, partial [Bdellovibrionales bacterium]|nr:GDP-mannose 4,6-dehydratase [Bdellovibrionales bacterium]